MGAPPPQWPSLETFVICTLWAVGTLGVGWWLFRRRAVTFAKEV
jgi:ABC-type polysaccharide/polyol phosphate export permease